MNGHYTTPYLVLATLALLLAFILDLKRHLAEGERRAKIYPLTLFFMNFPMVIIAFFVPLINGNRNIGEILIYGVPLTIAMFIGLFITVPVIGFVFGLITDALKMSKVPHETKHSKA